MKCEMLGYEITARRSGPLLLLYVGRLGTEKNIAMIKDVLERIPEARLAIVGAGPAEAELRAHFAGTDTVFMGLMCGEVSCQPSGSRAALCCHSRPNRADLLPLFLLCPLLPAAVLPVCLLRFNAGLSQD